MTNTLSIPAIVVVWILLLIFLGSGIFFIIRSIQYYKKAKRCLGWPSVAGRVLKSFINDRYYSDSEYGVHILYEPRIEYEYQVMGTSFTSNRLFIGPALYFPNLRRSQDILNRLTDGTTVKVFYNPDDPSESVLEPRWNIAFSLITGITLTVIGLFLLYRFLIPL